MMVPNKAKWIREDQQLFAKKYGVPLNFNPHGIINILAADRAAAHAEELGEIEILMEKMYPAMWVEGKDLSDLAVLHEIIRTSGLDSDDYIRSIEAKAVKDRLKNNTQEAADRGAFGAPTFFVDDKLFFGQDRLEFVENALNA